MIFVTCYYRDERRCTATRTNALARGEIAPESNRLALCGALGPCENLTTFASEFRATGLWSPEHDISPFSAFPARRNEVFSSIRVSTRTYFSSETDYVLLSRGVNGTEFPGRMRLGCVIVLIISLTIVSS